LAAGDFTSDDRDEIVAAVPTANGTDIRLYNKIGAFIGGFSLAQKNLTVSVSDLNLDGVPDIVVAPQHSAGDVQLYDIKGNLESTVGENLVGEHGTYLGAW